ncbi:MAG: hypothetical protein E7160_04600 [Firmicutes bacterium]|nr:hypothetical protein [Bacillota bacterium]
MGEASPLSYFYRRCSVKDKVIALVEQDIKDLNVFVDDAYVSTEEGKDILNIVLDSSEVIDLNKVTEASRIINKLLDSSDLVGENIYEVDIFSKEKGEE